MSLGPRERDTSAAATTVTSRGGGAVAGRERHPFKTDVRKLKELGLTESLEVGYRLSPRGRTVLSRLESAD